MSKTEEAVVPIPLKTNSTADQAPQPQPQPDAAETPSQEKDQTAKPLDPKAIRRAIGKETDKEVHERAIACNREVEDVLRKYNCRIVARFNPPEMVGEDGTKILMSCSYWVIPQVKR